MRKLIGSLALVALLPLPARADFATPIVELDLASGAVATTGPSCPGQTLVGGGFDTEFPVTLQNISSEPLLAGTSSWRAGLFNPGPDASFAVAAICSDEPIATEGVESEFAVPSDAVTSRFAFCPFGQVAFNGGIRVTGAQSQRSTMLLAPAWPFDPAGTRLRDRADGETSAPTAWEAVVRNDSTSSSYVGTASALCAQWSDVVTVIDSSSIAAGQVDSGVVLCPAGTSAVGGGVDAEDRTGLRLVASAPVFPGTVLPMRITDLANGTAGAPIGWRVALRSDALTTRSLKVAAVCAPEPGGGVLGAAALGALGWRARRRESHGRP